MMTYKNVKVIVMKENIKQKEKLAWFMTHVSIWNKDQKELIKPTIIIRAEFSKPWFKIFKKIRN